MSRQHPGAPLLNSRLPESQGVAKLIHLCLHAIEDVSPVSQASTNHQDKQAPQQSLCDKCAQLTELYRDMLDCLVLHCIALHGMKLHCIHLHYVLPSPFKSITSHHIEQPYITLHFITLRYVTLHYIT